MAEGGTNCGQFQISIVALPELLRVGPLSPLDMAVELGGAWWEDEELQVTALAGDLKLAHELGAAVDLNGADGEGRALLDGGKEVGGGAGSGYRVDFNHVPAGYDIAGGEMLQDDTRQRSQVQGI